MRDAQAFLLELIQKRRPKALTPVAETGSFMWHLMLKVQLSSEVRVIWVPWPPRE
jgi:hypothetical protein